MNLQKNTLYALYSVLESASRPEQKMSTGEIARTYGVSPHHLAKVMRVLVRAKLVASVRGVGGGYQFTGNAKRLTLLDVIDLFERVGAPVRSAAGRRRGPGDGVQRALGTVFSEIDEISRATLRSMSIATMLKLIERQRRDSLPGRPTANRDA